jgi:hypothetical protein
MDGFAVCNALKAAEETRRSTGNLPHGQARYGFRCARLRTLARSITVFKPFQAEEIVSRVCHPPADQPLTRELRERNAELEREMGRTTQSRGCAGDCRSSGSPRWLHAKRSAGGLRIRRGQS